MNNNFWRGEKIRLRAEEPKDIGTFFKCGSDYDDETDRLCDKIHFPRSFESLKAYREDQIKQGPKNDSFRWIIEDREGTAVGTINTFDCNPQNGTFKYGLGIVREHWSEGYAKEAIRMVLRYYFHELRYQKVNAHVYAFNERSFKLHENLGFQKEGVLRRMVFTQGRHHDEIVFGITKEEFDALDKGNLS